MRETLIRKEDHCNRKNAPMSEICKSLTESHGEGFFFSRVKEGHAKISRIFRGKDGSGSDQDHLWSVTLGRNE